LGIWGSTLDWVMGLARALGLVSAWSLLLGSGSWAQTNLPKNFAPHIFVTFFVAVAAVDVAIAAAATATAAATVIVVVLISHLAFDFKQKSGWLFPPFLHPSGGYPFYRRSTLIALKFQVGLSIPTINYKFVGCLPCCCLLSVWLLMRMGIAEPLPLSLPLSLHVMPTNEILMFFKPFLCVGLAKVFATY